MGKISAKLRSVEGGAYGHWCPGCRQMHVIHVDSPNHCGAQWSFDGNVEARSGAPLVNIFVAWTWSHLEDERGLTDVRCHYSIRAGQIEFCGDSTHALAGKTVPLPDLPEEFQ
jgi:hypothetical protein